MIEAYSEALSKVFRDIGPETLVRCSWRSWSHSSSVMECGHCSSPEAALKSSGACRYPASRVRPCMGTGPHLWPCKHAVRHALLPNSFHYSPPNSQSSHATMHLSHTSHCLPTVIMLLVSHQVQPSLHYC